MNILQNSQTESVKNLKNRLIYIYGNEKYIEYDRLRKKDQRHPLVLICLDIYRHGYYDVYVGVHYMRTNIVLDDKLIEEAFSLSKKTTKKEPEVFDQLKNAMKSEFPAFLDPFQFIENTQDRLAASYSFITVKGNKPVAFITVTTKQK